MKIDILLLGDIVGKPGRRFVCAQLPEIRRRLGLAGVVANAENAWGGSGITEDIARELLAAGVDAITMGDHFFRKKECAIAIERVPEMVRPANFAATVPGKGTTIVELVGGQRLAVINLIGRVFMDPAECPFLAVDRELARLPQDLRLVVVDLHAEATSEKRAMGWYLAGRVSAVVGSHSHVPTNDAEILPGGTAYLTDCGMCGPYRSVIGREIEPVIKKFKTGMFHPFDVAREDVRLGGLIVTVETMTGRAAALRPFIFTEADAVAWATAGAHAATLPV